MTKPPKLRIVAVAAVATGLALGLAACGGDDSSSASSTTAAPASQASTTAAPASSTTAAPSTTAAAKTTIVDVAAGSSDFKTLVAAVKAAGLVDTLSGPGPFTVFAPTDAAFATALKSLNLTAEQLLADKATLTKILTYHVVAGEVPASKVLTMNGTSVATVNGAKVDIKVSGSSVSVNTANVTKTDIKASNGVIHVIDSVLLPPAG